MSHMSTGTTILSAEATARFLGRCDTCDRPVAAIVEDTHGDHANIACPDCAGPCPAQRLYGTMSVEHCNAACEGARGPQCACSCAGANHGGAWAKPGTMLADQLAAYRADKARRTAQAAKRREARRTAAADARTLWTATHEDVVAYLTTGDIGWSDFLTELADTLDNRGELTPGQVDAVRRNITRQAERDAARAARPAPTAPPVGATKVVITGTVTAAGHKDAYRGGVVVYTMTVLDDRGFRVCGTRPRSIHDAKPGDRVTFVAGEIVAATWAPDATDLAGFKRPADARILTATPV
jgi:hypothetical protein